jgi:cytochrome b subunit of formate dehydrogenase
MNKAKINYFIDVGLGISFFICFITGLIKWPRLIKIIGTTAYRNLNIRALSMLHDFSGLAMGILVVIHLILHWKWIVSMTKCIFNRQKKEKNNC